MGRPYRDEMKMLAGTFEWACQIDFQPLRQAVRGASHLPLRAFGSGGSLTVAHALADLHERYTRNLATASTPLSASARTSDPVAVWLLSAAGGNTDIISAARALIQREPRHLGVLCGSLDSRLAKLCQKHRFVNLLTYRSPAGKDGFLATNSLLGFTALLCRAYAAEYDSDSDWNDAVDRLKPLLAEGAPAVDEWEAATADLWARPTTMVLHGTETRIGAVDLESKFSEAAIGHVQFADYRNFAHGRHHWLAKRGNSSAVLAFVTNADRELAERTLALIPASVPRARIELDGNPIALALASLVAALRITGWAGTERGIDPGRPGVPSFGRKIYNLRPRLDRSVSGSPVLRRRDAVALERKTDCSLDRLAAGGQLPHWRAALADFRRRLYAGRFAGVVFDYDGTLVDARNRASGPDPAIGASLARLVEAGVGVAIATGRGKSVRQQLQRCMDPSLWSRILVGYYNGAEVGALSDDGIPDGSDHVRPELGPLKEALQSRPELVRYAQHENRHAQITLMASNVLPVGRLWEIASEVANMTGLDGVTVTRSDHSVDVLAPGVTKMRVVSQLRETVGSGPILFLGGHGRWPGNDYRMLGEPYALSVDQVSIDPDTCWNLGAPGQRGPSVTLEYLSALEVQGGRFKFAAGALS